MRSKIIALDPIIDDYFIEQITKRIGIHTEIQAPDYDNIAFYIDRGIESLLDFTNRITIPPRLKNSLIEYIVNDYIVNKEQLEGISQDVEITPAITQVSEGDTTIQFEKYTGKQSERLNYFFKKRESAKEEWLSYRKLKWI